MTSRLVPGASSPSSEAGALAPPFLEGLRRDAAEARGAVDWDRVERAVVGGSPPGARTAILALVAVGWVGLVAWLSAPAGMAGGRMVRVVPTMVVLAALVALAGGRASRRLVAHVERPDALAVARQLAEADLAWARRMQWSIAALVLFFLYQALTGTAATYDPMVFFGGLALPLVGAWAWLRHLRVPRAAREVRDLAEAGAHADVVARAGAMTGTAREGDEALLAAVRAGGAAGDAALAGLLRAMRDPLHDLCLHVAGRREDAVAATVAALRAVRRWLPRHAGGAAVPACVLRVGLRAALQATARRADRADAPLAALPARHRVVLALLALEGVSRADAATVLGVDEGAASRMVNEALRALPGANP